MDKEQERLRRARTRATSSLVELAKEEARVNERARERDTRRKILLGAAVEVMMRTDANLLARFESFMPGYLTRPADLDVFDLVGSDVTYFDRLAGRDDPEVDAAVDALVDLGPAPLRLGAIKDAASLAPKVGSPGVPTASPAHANGSARGPQSRPPPLPPPPSSTDA